LRQPERRLLGIAISVAFCTLVGMPRVGNGVDLFDGVRRRMLAKSAPNDDVVVSGLCWCHSATPPRNRTQLTGFARRGRWQSNACWPAKRKEATADLDEQPHDEPLRLDCRARDQLVLCFDDTT